MSGVFRQFRNGAMVFFGGLAVVYLASQMPASWQQEIVLLGGLALAGIGFVVAMLAQVRLVIGRIVQFMQKK
ncbi:hypothetical protein FKG94_01960 [Exilibacterium tricleocarpae]|uniref:Uncharacterized protein n=1 Tax=Exilibacterium tricleocarpae TaxID=2591008 RepID=A0A545U8G4_9GAMM|nr:hypothetical protein FKG94_01960 [Exilibacterium tricleocarpae]